MKKTKQIKRLNLGKTTVRVLCANDLQNIAGGAVTDTCNCPSRYCTEFTCPNRCHEN